MYLSCVALFAGPKNLAESFETRGNAFTSLVSIFLLANGFPHLFILYFFQRGFPTITFTLILLGVMVTLTALFLLYRHVRPSDEEPAYSAIPPTQDD